MKIFFHFLKIYNYVVVKSIAKEIYCLLNIQSMCCEVLAYPSYAVFSRYFKQNERNMIDILINIIIYKVVQRFHETI